MKTGYCETCDKDTAWKREFGFGFWFGVVITGGLWLLTIPLKPLRCTECGTEMLRKSERFHRKNYKAV